MTSTKHKPKTSQEALKEGVYYLHREGDLIFKPFGGVDPKDPTVLKLWKVGDVFTSPTKFLLWLAELHELGVNPNRIAGLATLNRLEKFIPEWRDEIFPKPPEEPTIQPEPQIKEARK